MTASIASAVTTTGPSALSINVTAPSGLSSGDTVVVHLDANTGAQTWSAPDGTWTLIGSNTTVAAFIHVVTGTEPSSWTFTRTGINAVNVATATRITGANGSDVYAIITRAARASVAFSSLTATEANSLAVYSICTFASATPWTSPSGVTEAVDDASGLVASEVLASSGATTARTFTPTGGSVNCSGLFVIIKSAAAGGGGVANGNVKITYQASNTFTCPAGVTSIRVQCEGAGGPGGNGATLNRGGGGGGAAYAEEPTLTVVPGRTYTVTVPGTASTVGTAGGNAQFVDNVTSTVLVKAAGGGAGGNASGLSNGSAGAAGLASNSIGSIKTDGTAGTAGGAGGAGAPPLGGAGGTTTPGVSAGGGGGGGAALNGAGQAGAQGVVIVTFTYANESLAATDSVQLLVTWNRAFNETVAATDPIAKSVLKPLSETVTVTDSPAKLLLKKPTDETLTTADAITRLIQFLRDEPIVASDFRAMLLQRALTENISVADAFTRLLTKTYTEVLSSTDAMTQYLQKPMTENLTATDLAVIILVYIRNVVDTAAAADVVSKVAKLSQSDSVAVVDSAVKLVVKKFPTESVATSDSAFVSVIYSRFPNDAVSPVDTLSKKMILGFDDSISGSVVVAPTGRRIFAILSD